MMRTHLMIAAFVAVTPHFVTAQEPAAKPDLLILTGANNHDWRWTSRALRDIFVEAGCFGEVVVTDDPATMLEDPASVARFETFVIDYNGPRWGEAAEQTFVDAVRGGAGLTIIHAANNAFPGWIEYEKMVGLGWRRNTGHGRYHLFDVHVVDPYHPITRGMPDIEQHPDEIYHRLEHLHDVDLRVLTSAYSDPKTGGTGRAEPTTVVLRYGEGRVFHTTLGHVWKGVPRTRATLADPQFRQLLSRGTEWAATGATTLSPAPTNWLTPEEKAAGFILLFDGKSTAQWRGYGKTEFPAYGWFVENGVLVHEEGATGGDLMTFDAYGDFDFRFEWMVREGGNSGVIYRVTEEQEASWMTGPEYQVLDDAVLGENNKPAALSGAGALYALQALPPRKPRPVGSWNEGRIVVRGWHVQHWLNGKKVVDLDLASEAGATAIAASKFKEMPQFAKNIEGFLVLQDHGSFVAYRNLRVKPL